MILSSPSNLRLWLVLCSVLASGVLLDPGVSKAGDVEGRVSIKRPSPSSPKIVSRSIIRRYVTKSLQRLERRHEAAEAPPTVVVYIDNPVLKTESTDGRMAVLDQQKETFVPHVLPILVGTTVKFTNSDQVYHNVFSYSKTKSFDLGRYATGKSRTVRFDKPGVVKVYCDIHSHMNAFILVLTNPYFATTNKEGRFKIKNVPAGNYTLKAWYGRWPEKSEKIKVEAFGSTEVNFDFP